MLDTIKIILSAGVLTILWQVFQLFSENHQKKQERFLKINQKIIISYFQIIEPYLFNFPKNEAHLKNLYLILLELEEKISTNEKLYFFKDDLLFKKLVQTNSNIKMKIDKDNLFNNHKARNSFLGFSERYFYLVNQFRKINGLKKYGLYYRWKHMKLFDLFFPFDYFIEKILIVLLKIIKIYFIILAILIILNILLYFLGFASL